MNTESLRARIPDVKAAVAACFAADDAPAWRRMRKTLMGELPDIGPALTSSRFSGKRDEVLVAYPRRAVPGSLLVVGLGPGGELTPERLRRAAASAVAYAKKAKAPSLALMEPDWETILPARASLSREDGVMALWEGALLASYEYRIYKTLPADAPPRLKKILLAVSRGNVPSRLRDIEQRARIVCGATLLARDLGNAPGNEIYPATLALRARRALEGRGVRVSVLGPPAITRLRMAGLLAVSAGSSRPPRFIMLRWGRPSPGKPTVVLVGKGITFDSGGISIKPSAQMAEMKMDMAGAAGVIGTFQAVSRMGLPVHLVGLIPAAENLPGGSALKPGDILRHRNGITSEVDNTDAEGRLILADALSYASVFSPRVVIDLATLTGAVVVALGHEASGMMGNDPLVMEALRASGERTHERVWQLPMFEEYGHLVKSDVADVKNTGGRWAGAITGAKFLEKFIPPSAWVHLDIAGPAIMEKPSAYTPKGASGVGVRLLVDFLSRWDGRTTQRAGKE
ncbi:MAG: leucyl aminopeptidase [Bacteroidota bacterium]